MTRLGRLCLSTILIFSAGLHAETATEALLRAEAAVQAAAPRAEADPAHPIFHVASPAQWMNDPNGPIYHNGVYHLFYQLTPFSDRSGVKYWGHVTSRNLFHWMHQPIAIAPSGDLGEESIWSGCCTVNDQGRPMIFYTSIGQGKSAFDQATQWAAYGDAELIRWQKLPGNPVLSEEVNAGTKIYDWRDPFIFKEAGHTFMVLGGHLERNGGAAVSIYEAQDPELTRWQYRGVLFELPSAPTAECPNFFKLGKEWMLCLSPYGKVQYFLGRFDVETCKFTARTNGLVDFGPNYYAPNTMFLPRGGRLMWGWVNGFPDGLGWNGCLSLPRQLSVARDGQLRLVPAPPLKRLRGKAIKHRKVELTSAASVFALPQTNAFEIAAVIDLKSCQALELSVQAVGAGAGPVEMSYADGHLQVLDERAPLRLPKGARKLSLRVFIDRSVLEVFANDTVCFTKRIEPITTARSLEIRSEGGPAVAKLVAAWPLKGIW